MFYFAFAGEVTKREAGVNPARSRRCMRGVKVHVPGTAIAPNVLFVREGELLQRSASQKTCIDHRQTDGESDKLPANFACRKTAVLEKSGTVFYFMQATKIWLFSSRKMTELPVNFSDTCPAGLGSDDTEPAWHDIFWEKAEKWSVKKENVMKAKTNYKRIVAFLLVFAMVIATGASGIGNFAGITEEVYADANPTSVTANVTIASQKDGAFLHAITTAAVRSDLAESYGFTDNVASTTSVSALDVLVKAHEIKYGSSFTQSNVGDYLAVTASGSVTKEFGVATYSTMYFVNGYTPNDGVMGAYGCNGYMINQAVVQTGDLVEFYFMQDTSYYMDNYSFFMKNDSVVRNIYAFINENINLNLNGYTAMYYGTYPPATILSTYAAELNGANLYTVNPDTGAMAIMAGKTTDSNGDVTLSFSSEGTYYVTIDGDYTDEADSPCMMPLLRITVVGTSTAVADDVLVTIPGSESFTGIAHPVILQSLNINSFDIRPFMTGDTLSYQPTASIKTANALIEAVYYSIYGRDPSASDLNVSADSDVARAIKAKLNIGMGSWGLSQNSIYGNSSYQMSAIDNQSCWYGIGQQDVSSGDKVAFYSYADNENYSYFDVLNAEPSIAWGAYPNIHLKLRQNYLHYDSSWNTVSDPVEASSVNANNYDYGNTNANGIIEFDVMDSDTSGSHSFIVKGTSDYTLPAYLKVSYHFDGTTISALSITETVSADTAVQTLSINGTNAINFQANNLPMNVVTADSSVSLNVAVRDTGAATISGRAIYVNGNRIANEFPDAAGGTVSVPLTNGTSVISFTVCNGTDSEDYSITVVKSASAADNGAVVTAVINGIADYTGYAAADYTYGWILAKKAAGKTISDAEKNAFLASVLSEASAASSALTQGQKAKMAIALSALSIDATRVPASNTTIVDMAERAFSTNAASVTIYDLPYILMLHDLNLYESSSNAACSREAVIENILNKYNEYDNWGTNNGWSCGNSMGPDASAMMLPALAPYYRAAAANTSANGISYASCAAIKALVDAEIASYSAIQNSDNGTIGNNANSTAMVISALASVGVNPDTDTRFVKSNNNSLVDGLLLYKSSDNRLGYTSRTYNALASLQGLEALGNYRDFLAGGDGCQYAFAASVAPYTSWPADVRLLTDIIVTMPAKTTYNVGEAFDTSGMAITAVYNGNSASTAAISTGYTVSPANGTTLGTAGVRTVTVEYQGISKTFNIVVNQDASTPYQVSKVNVRVQSTTGTIAQDSNLVINEGTTTVMDVLRTVLNAAGKTCVIRNGGAYVASIDGLGEFDGGPNSGWMYNVNNVTPQVPANECELHNGDTVLWYYTLDFTRDSRNTGGMGETAATETEGTVSSSVETAATVVEGRATASISSNDVSKAIEKVTEQAKADTTGKTAEKEVVLEIKANGNADAVEAKLPAEAVKALAGADVNTVIATDCGNVEIPSDSLANINSQANGKDLSVAVENKKSEDVITESVSEKIKEETGIGKEAIEGASIVDVTIKAGDSEITSFGGRSIRLSLPVLGQQIVGRLYKVIAISANGALDMLTGKCSMRNGVKVMDLSSTHLTTFVLTSEEVKNPFSDVKESDYFYNPVLWAVEKNVTSGKTADTFAPFDGCTRAQMVTFLWRASGSPWASANWHFSDVPEDAYYADAVEWAIAAGIAKGTSENTFDPNGSVTREQLAAFIYRYAQDKGQGFTGAWMFLLDYNDASQVSEWADEAMHWCVMKGIVSGTGEKTLSPKGEANRAQIVTMLYRYFENYSSI